MRLADFQADASQSERGRRFNNMAEAVTSAAWNAPGCAGRRSSDSAEEEMAEPAGDDAEPLERLVELGVPDREEDENAELVAEAEAVAAGWMLDFLCLSLCRAFRDGRPEHFRRTRDSAEGECGPSLLLRANPAASC